IECLALLKICETENAMGIKKNKCNLLIWVVLMKHLISDFMIRYCNYKGIEVTGLGE
ncbi:11918_t:CDS:2, partial [Dentiscutata heterogama]